MSATSILAEEARVHSDIWALLDATGERLGVTLGEVSSVQVHDGVVVLPEGTRGDEKAASNLAHHLAHAVAGRRCVEKLPTPPAGCEKLWEMWSVELEVEEAEADRFAGELLAELAKNSSADVRSA